MAYEIKIYGEIVSTYAKQNGSKGFSLTDIQSQLQNAEGQDVKVRINSVGGDVDEGFAIYNELRRYAKENKAAVHTFAEAVCASIATVIFLAGDKRTVSKNLSPFVHLAWMDVSGNANDMRKAAETLEECNQQIAQHYAEHTDLTLKEALALMTAETSISPKEAVAMRFATDIEKVARPAAMQRFASNLNRDKMNKKTIWAKIEEIFKTVQNKKVNAADQTVVDFFELADDDVIEVGAKATIDGNPAEGEVVMETGETYVFVAGELTEIIPAEEEVAVDTEALDAANARIAELEGQLASASSENTELKAQAKTMRTALSNIKKLQSEIVDDEPAPATKARKPLVEVKGEKAKSAVASYTQRLTQTKK